MTRRLSPAPGCRLPWLVLLGLFGFWAVCLADQPFGEGEPLLQHFSPRDYDGNAQCLSATQDARGTMYVGSLGVILEYDGSAWRKINIESNLVASLAYDAATDTVFVGAENDLGFLQTLPGGERVFVSLRERLMPDQRAVGTVYAVHVTPDGVFFVGTRQVMRLRDGVFKTWGFATASRLKSDWAAGRFYASSPEVGLLRLEKDAFIPASDDPIFHEVSVRSILAEPDGSLLVGTFHHGLFTLRDGLVTPRDNECAGFLKEKGIARMLRLRNGSTAVATDSAGLLLLDRSLRFRSHADNVGGARGTNIHSLFEDAEGGVWIALQSGVTRAEVESPLSILRAGPDDDMSENYCTGRWFGKFVLGNATGLYRVVPADPSTATSAHIERVPRVRNMITSLCTVENGLLVLSQGKVTLLDAEARLSPAADEIDGIRDLCASRVHPGRVYAIDEGGRVSTLRFDRETRRWAGNSLVADLHTAGGEYGLAESARGDLWVLTKEHGLYRVEIPSQGPARVTSFFDQPGPLHGDPIVLASDGYGPLRFLGSSACCGFDDAGQTVRSLTEFGPQFQDSSLHVCSALSWDARTLWFSASVISDPMGYGLRGRAVAGGPDHAPTFRPFPRKIDALIGPPGIMLPMDDPAGPLTTLLLIGSGPEVVRMDVSRWDAEPEPPPSATRIVRAFTTNKIDGRPANPPILAVPLPHTRNSPHFEFAAGTLGIGASPRFQSRLVNFGAGEWSDFSERNSVDYLNLPEGSYVFEVRARNADGHLGSAASRPFQILPPWQRTPWAYAGYALILGIVLAAFIRWRGRRLRRRNAVLESLVDARTGELRGRETDLVRARDEADAANRAKSAFLANMSHELRTPLNAVLGYAQLLLKQTDLSARSRERITVIGQSGGHLLSLVNEVLDLSKVEAGKLTLSQFDFSLQQLLDEVVAAVRARFSEKGLTFMENRAPGLPLIVHTDPSRLRQVLFNLLGNAAKFTHHGGVTLTVRPAGPGRVRFEVTDSGVGIDPGDQRDIFLAFHQAGESSLASQGTGLGLTISQRLVELLGGWIEVESTPGQGSRFWFDLPLATVEPSFGLAPHATQDPGLGKVTGYEGATRRLLLVDDLKENRLVLRDFLQPLGFEIEEAVDGTACLETCARQMPDAVLLDLRLGTPDGFEVARTLRANQNGARPGIIAISASVFESDRQQAIDAGCDDFLPKPFEESHLLGTLGRVMGLRWLHETPADAVTPAAGTPADAEVALPASEIARLRVLSLSGDVAGIRRRLDAWQGAGAGEIVRRLESLVAAYDMEGIHEFLLTIQPHDGE